VDVTVRGEVVKTSKGGAFEMRARSLHASVERVASLSRLICPLRAAGIAVNLQPDPCPAAPVLDFSLGEPSLCGFHKVSIYADGTVHYTAGLSKWRGGLLWRTSGARNWGMARTDRLFGVTANTCDGGTLREGAARSAAEQVPPGPRARPCIDVTRPPRASPRTVLIGSDSRAGLAITKELAKVLPLARWVCPQRPQYEAPFLAFGDFCGGWYRSEAIVMSLYEPPACLEHHSVHVYDDGTIYYGVYEIGMGADDKRLDRVTRDAYYRVPTGKIADLVSLVAGLNVRQTLMEDCFGRCRGPNRASFETDSPSEIARFKQALDEAAAIRWQALAAPEAGSCASTGTLSTIYLRHDLARKTERKRASRLQTCCH
jgi:hypothetical protein